MPASKGSKRYSYRRFKKDKCESCGDTKNLDCHHIDGDQTNNKKSNIVTLCRQCHMKKHVDPYAWAWK